MGNLRTSSILPIDRVPATPPAESTAQLLRELAVDLRQGRNKLCAEWLRCIRGAHLLSAMTREEIVAKTTSVYDSYVQALETGSLDALEAWAPDLSRRVIPRAVKTHEVIGTVLLLRAVLARISHRLSDTEPWVPSSLTGSGVAACLMSLERLWITGVDKGLYFGGYAR